MKMQKQIYNSYLII